MSDSTFTFHFHALEKEMATHSSVLAWRIPGMGEPGTRILTLYEKNTQRYKSWKYSPQYRRTCKTGGFWSCWSVNGKCDTFGNTVGLYCPGSSVTKP